MCVFVHEMLKEASCAKTHCCKLCVVATSRMHEECYIVSQHLSLTSLCENILNT